MGIVKTKISGKQYYFLKEALKWVKGAIFQGERLLQEHIRFCEADDMYNELVVKYWGSVMEPPLPDKNIEDFERTFFSLALYSALFYLVKSSKSRLLNKITVDGFIEIKEIQDFAIELDQFNGAGHIKDIRDMAFAHIDEYIVEGKGNHPEKFKYRNEALSYEADATSTIVIGDQYMIGGRIDVCKTILKLQELLPRVESVIDGYTPVPIHDEEAEEDI